MKRMINNIPVLLAFLLLPFTQLQAQSNSPSIQFESNKLVGLLHFLEASVRAPKISPTYADHIQEKLGSDFEFFTLTKNYRKLGISDQLQGRGKYSIRHDFKTPKDSLWLAVAASADWNELDKNTRDFLSSTTRQQLINCFKEAEKYYDKLVWNSQKEKLLEVEKQFQEYLPKMTLLFERIARFYGTKWNNEIPFKVMLCPMPLTQGASNAFPQDNIIICSLLADNEISYLSKLDVIIHEMCHIVFNYQPKEFQNLIDQWFFKSDSEFTKLAYENINEGLATALGNGWAHQQLHGAANESIWYNNKYIDGYARSLYKLVANYLKQEKRIDQYFVSEAITLFEKAFPNATREINLIFQDLSIYVNVDDSQAAFKVVDQLRENFHIKSNSLSGPINDPRSVRSFDDSQKTKIFVITNEHAATLELLQSHYKDLNTVLPKADNFIYAFKDQESKSSVLIINLDRTQSLGNAINEIKKMKFLEYGRLIPT